MSNYPDADHHRDELVSEFVEGFKAKYDKGQAEHGGRLWRKNCSSMLLEEVLDFWAYAKTMDKQRQEAIAILRGVVQEGYLKCDDLRGVRGAIALLEGVEKDL